MLTYSDNRLYLIIAVPYRIRLYRRQGIIIETMFEMDKQVHAYPYNARFWNQICNFAKERTLAEFIETNVMQT